MRRLGEYFRRARRRADQAGPGWDGAAGSTNARKGGLAGADVETLMREIDTVARYVSSLRREIGALRPNEIYRDRLPRAHDDLTSIATISETSANAIMNAGETILACDATTVERYREQVEGQVFAIFEACSFRDVTGQRVARIDETIGQLERRLQRFALAVKAADTSGGFDREAIKREVRHEILLVEGPQDPKQAVDQRAIDDMFG